MHDLALIAAVALELPFERLAVCALKLLANDHYVAFREHYTELVSPIVGNVYTRDPFSDC